MSSRTLTLEPRGADPSSLISQKLAGVKERTWFPSDPETNTLAAYSDPCSPDKSGLNTGTYESEQSQ